MSTLNKNQLIQALERNLIAKFSYFQKQIKDMEIIKRESLLLINSYEMTDMFNTIFCFGNTDHEQVNAAIHYFKSKNLPFSWWVGFENEPSYLAKILEENGLKKSEEELAMAMELNASVRYDAPKDLAIQQVNDEEKLIDFVRVITDLIPDEQIPLENFFRKAESILLTSSDTELYVGYVNAQPVSTCSVFFTDKVAGIFDIIASTKVRGMGIGTAMTQTAMQAAFNRGCTHCILTATNDAKFLYEKIGFQALKLMYVYS